MTGEKGQATTLWFNVRNYVFPYTAVRKHARLPTELFCNRRIRGPRFMSVHMLTVFRKESASRRATFFGFRVSGSPRARRPG